MSTVTIPEEKLAAMESMARTLLVQLADIRKEQKKARELNEKPHVKKALDRFRRNQFRTKA